jgi:NAD-dependent deacetylase
MTRLPEEVLKNIRLATEIIRAAHHTIVLTGAGSSTPSGIPDFRSAEDGLWTRFSPMEVASLTAFRHHPVKFYKWLRPLAQEMLNARPNAAHYAFADLEKRGIVKKIITQNVDGLHQRAGSADVLEVHGSFETLTCIGCYRQYPSEGFIEPYIQQGKIPSCPNCNKYLKPNVILFEEQLPRKVWLKSLEEVKKCDLLIVAGSSLVVMPVAGLPMTAVENNAHIIVVNNAETYIDECADVTIHGDLADIIPELAREVLNA